MALASRHPSVHPARIAASLLQVFAWLRQRVRADGYRPERYYMRGPGPKASERLGPRPDGK